MNEQYWKEKAGVDVEDPNFLTFLEEALSAELDAEKLLKQAKADLGLNKRTIPVGQKLNLHKPQEVDEVRQIYPAD